MCPKDLIDLSKAGSVAIDKLTDTELEDFVKQIRELRKRKTDTNKYNSTLDVLLKGLSYEQSQKIVEFLENDNDNDNESGTDTQDKNDADTDAA